MYDLAGQALGPVAGDRGGGGLLQCLVGEQPARDLSKPGELADGFAAQQRGFDQSGGVAGEPLPDGGDIGNPACVGQREPGNLGQRCRPGIAGQVGDIGPGKAQVGLTPVIITL